MSVRETWDVFCRVVDNYGDIGIAWRLARQLASGRRTVRLFVDDLASFARIEPRVGGATPVDGVDIHRWPIGARIDGASVVVEMLGCGLPAPYLAAMVDASPAPVWIDFEHLSAESWVDGFHGLPSPHPTLPLTKHFYYPGFNERTGGLLVESDIERQRCAFVDDDAAVASFRRRLGLAGATRQAALFAYPDAPVAGLLDTFAHHADNWSVALPEGVLAERVDRWFGTPGAVGRTRTRGSLAVTIVPLVDQADFDRLLWTSDVNFVRGEDSLVRAQLAGRPFVWQTYRQSQDAHHAKRGAFDALHEAGWDGGTRRVRRAFSDAWNEPDANVASAASAWLACRDELTIAADRWRSQIVAREPLLDRLVAFANVRRRVP